MTTEHDTRTSPWIALRNQWHVRLHRRRDDMPQAALCGVDLRRSEAGYERAARCRMCVAVAARKGLL